MKLPDDRPIEMNVIVLCEGVFLCINAESHACVEGGMQVPKNCPTFKFVLTHIEPCACLQLTVVRQVMDEPERLKVTRAEA